jgi:hypothetical protein
MLQRIVQSVRARRDPGSAMFLATLICSDEHCAEAVELVVSHELDALDAAACPCGCTLVLLAVSEWERAPRPALALAA